MEEEIWSASSSDPHEHWADIEDFPGYAVSDKGRVRNNSTGRILVLTQNQYGVIKVGMIQDGRQHSRSVALLVANHHVEKPVDNEIFDTPINLDGDRHNNAADNLMWRPRWFALKYHKQFEEGQRKGFRVPIQALRTGVIYKDSMDAAMHLGILAEDTVRSVMMNHYVFPTFQKFKVLENANEDSYVA